MNGIANVTDGLNVGSNANIYFMLSFSPDKHLTQTLQKKFSKRYCNLTEPVL